MDNFQTGQLEPHTMGRTRDGSAKLGTEGVGESSDARDDGTVDGMLRETCAPLGAVAADFEVPAVARHSVATPNAKIASTAVAGLELHYHADFEGLEDIWATFQHRAVGPAFHSLEWCSAWHQTVGRSRGDRAAIVVGYDATGEVVFLLPFAVRDVRGFGTLTWLGEDEAAYAFGLWSRTFVEGLDSSQHSALFNEIVRVCPGVSSTSLRRMPADWDGLACPLITADARPAPDNSYIIDLSPGFDETYAGAFGRRSRETTKRKKRGLERIGKVEFFEAGTQAARQEILETFFAQKTRQLVAKGIAGRFDDDAIRAFYLRLADAPAVQDSEKSRGHQPPTHEQPHAIASQPYLQCFGVSVDGEVVATFNGLTYRDRFHLLISSLAEGDVRRYSPGHLLMCEQVRMLDAQGINTYDLGPGAASHKAAWKAISVPLVDVVAGITPLGRLHAAASASGNAIKRRIKQDERLWPLVQIVRRILFARKAKPSE